MRIEIQKIGELIKDQPGFQLPNDAITSAENVRYNDQQLGTFTGHSSFFTGTVAPYFILPVTDGSTYYWVYMGLAKGYIYNGASSTDITRATGGDYTGTATDRWNGCIINGVPVVNNGVDDPQMFTPIQITSDLALLTGWNTAWKAKVIRQYKNFLIALNITKSSTEYPHRVKWSDIADTGTVPPDWDETSTTNLAGENDLSETDGVLVDGAQLRDEFIIYKEDAVYGMQYIGGTSVFRFRRIRGLGGILAQQCAIEFQGGHFVVGGPASRDIYVHDGQNQKSVAEDRVRDAFFVDLDQDNYASTFCVHVSRKNEIWIFYPQTGQTLPNRVLIWNYRYDRWTFRDIPANTTHGDNGIVDVSAYTWDTLPYSTWDEWTGTWGSRTYSPLADTLVTSSTDLDLYKYEDGNQFDGLNATCTIERIGLDFGKTTDVHMVTAIYPYMEGQSVNFYIGTQDIPNGSVTWDGPHSFDPSTDYKIDIRASGNFHCWRATSTANVQWAISGIGFEVELEGER